MLCVRKGAALLMQSRRKLEKSCRTEERSADQIEEKAQTSTTTVSTQILSDKKGTPRPDLLLLLDVSSVQLKNPITKMKERCPLNM